MHIIQLKIHHFLEQVKQGKIKLSDEIIEKFAQASSDVIKKAFETTPRDFRISLGNIGKPSCMLEFEAMGYKGEPFDPLKAAYGYLTEELLVLLIKASGIKVVAEQLRVSLDIQGNIINGVLDLLLDLDDGYYTVWDIKSASNYAFKNKFTSFDKLLEEDTFGYALQVILYTHAARNQTFDKPIKTGGIIAFDKSSGEIGVVQADREYEDFNSLLGQSDILSKLLSSIKRNNNGERVKDVYQAKSKLPNRLFGLVEETFNKKPTGNKYLCKTCEFCSFKFDCWKRLQVLPALNSTAKNPPLRYYVDDNNKES